MVKISLILTYDLIQMPLPNKCDFFLCVIVQIAASIECLFPME